ncbi:MAG: ATP-dependent DNA helicase RecG, partial [Muribaculaceae bacterium]|nr:ATP-dependent DNA helicase RecG [Muribaculaceae bacterium]
MQNFLDTEIKFLKGVGEARAKLLASELEVATFRDLLYYFPFRHIDRSRFYRIEELAGNDMPAIQIKGHFISFRMEGEGARKRLVGVFSDGRRMMETVWFSKVKQFSEMFKPGIEYVVFGKPSFFNNAWSIAHPEVEVFDAEKPPTGFRGVYSLTETMRKRGFGMRVLQTIIGNLFGNRLFSTIRETLPREIVERYGLMPLQEALRQMHFPDDVRSLQRAT